MLIFFSDGLVVSHLPFGPTAYFTLSNTVMRHDIPKIGTMSEAYPHLIFHNFNSKLGERVCCEHVISVILPKKLSNLQCTATHVHRVTKKHAPFYFLEQVKSILKYLYPVPKDDSRRVITFANQEDYISFRWVIFKRILTHLELFTCKVNIKYMYSFKKHVNYQRAGTRVCGLNVSQIVQMVIGQKRWR